VTTRKGDKTYTYLKLVHGYRQGGRVRTRLVANLGAEEELKASGQLEHLAAAFARRDPPMVGVRREVGALLLVKHFLERLGLAKIVERHLPTHGRAQLTNAEVVTALIANRLCAPSPLYDISGWASSAAIQELFGIPAMLLNDDRLGRLLDDFAAQAEAVRGAVAVAAIEEFGLDAGRLHLDLTNLRMYGAYESSALVAKGWNAERKLERQVKVLQATTPLGISLYVRPGKGSAAEISEVAAALEQLSRLLPPGLVICTDSALGHLKTLCEVVRAKLSFVIPLRESTGFQERFLEEFADKQALEPIRYVCRRRSELPVEQQTQYRGSLRPWLIEDPETCQQRTFSVAYIWSSEEERSVQEGRQRALAKAEDELGRVQRGLGGAHYKTPADVQRRVGQILQPVVKELLRIQIGDCDGKPTLHFERVAAAIEQAEKLDGIYALASNLPGVTAQELLRLYKDQSLVELRHHDLKGSLRVRPIFLHNDRRIEALVSIVGLAILVFGLIELDLRRSLGQEEEMPGLLPEGRSARPTGRNILSAFQGLGLTYGPRTEIRLDRLTATQRRILDLLGVNLPWSEQPTSGSAA
jgi:transposase